MFKECKNCKYWNINTDSCLIFKMENFIFCPLYGYINKNLEGS